MISVNNDLLSPQFALFVSVHQAVGILRLNTRHNINIIYPVCCVLANNWVAYIWLLLLCLGSCGALNLLLLGTLL